MGGHFVLEDGGRPDVNEEALLSDMLLSSVRLLSGKLEDRPI